MKISVILAFLLFWGFASSNPHHQQVSNHKGVGELNDENDGGSDSSNLARTESSDDVFSGRDWGGDISSPFGQTGLDGTGDADERLGHFSNHEPHLTLISGRSKMGVKSVEETAGGIKKMIGTSTPNNESSDIPSNGEDLSDDNHNENILPRTRENTEVPAFAGQDREAEWFVGEATKRHGNRAKKDSGTSALLWSSLPHIDSISEQLLKLSEGRMSNVLRSEKATVAEALNGGAIRRILEQARARAAKVVPHKDLYDTNDFSKWLQSDSPFDLNIFRHSHHRPSQDAEAEERPDTEDTDDALRHRTSSTPHSHVFGPTNRRRHHHHHHHHHHPRHREGKHIFSTLFEPTAADAAGTEHSYAKLLHKSKHRERLSPELQITSREGRARDETAGTFRKPSAVSRQAHRSLSYEDDTADDTGLQYYSHAPHTRLRVTEDEDVGNGMPWWRHAKWIHRFGARAPHSADSSGFDSGEEVDNHEGGYTLGSTFDGFGDEETGDEGPRAGRRGGHRISSGMDIYGGINRDSQVDGRTKLTDSYGKTNWEDIFGRKWYYYGIGDEERSDDEADAVAFGDTGNRHSADFLLERGSSVDSRRERNMRNKNKRPEHDGVERSAIYSTTSAEATSGERSGEVLTTKTSAGKATDVDVGHYRWRDRNVAANGATSLPPGLSGEKGSERTNNALTSPSADDGSAAARREAAESGVPRWRTRPAIDNDAAEIEMGFSGIESQPWADLPWAHSSLARVRSKTHLENQRAHRDHGGYERAVADAIASTGTEHSMDSDENAPLGRAKTRKHSPAGEHGNYADDDLGENQVVNGDAESSAEATSSVGREHRYGLPRTTAWSTDDSLERDYAGIDWEGLDLHDDHRWRGTSAEVIDFPDRSGETYILMPKFPTYKFRTGYGPYNVNYYDPNVNYYDPNVNYYDPNVNYYDPNVNYYDPNVNYYDPNVNYYYPNEEMRDDQEIEVGESTKDSKEGEFNYNGWEQEGTFSADHEAEKSTIDISNARRSGGRRNQHGEHAQRNRCTFNQFLHNNMIWSSSITNISEYEAWERYIAYLYYLWKQNGGKSDASFEATKESKKQDNAVDEEISLDSRGRKHTTDEDNYIHLRKHKKWPQRAGGSMIRNVAGLKQDKIKSITMNNGKASNEDYEEAEVKSVENVDNQREDQEALTRTGNMIREDSTVDIMSKARSSKRIIDNNSYRQQGSWNSLENSYADARIETDGYDSHRRNNKVDINQAVETTEFADSESDLRRMSETESSTSRSYAESQVGEHTVDTSSDLRKMATWTLASGKENEYRDEADSSDASAMSSESIDESQIKRVHHIRKKWRTDQENSASTETSAEAASLSGATDKSQSNVRDMMVASELSAESHVDSERYSGHSVDVRKHSRNAGTSANAISVKDEQESILENASSLSESSVQSEMEDYSNENMRNVGTRASSASSSESFAKSKAKAGKTENNSESIRMNANAKASSAAMLSDNARNEWSTSSSRSSAESRLESDYYLAEHKGNRINAISRSSASSMLSDTVVGERQSHLQRSSASPSSTSSRKLQAESQHDSNSIHNGQMNVATAESSATSASWRNAESGYWSDSSSSKSSSKSWEEAQQHNSNNVINVQESNIENRSELESASSSKSHVKSILKGERCLSVIEGNENNVVNAGVSLRTTSSAAAKDDHRQESASCSFAESQVEGRNGREKTSMSSTTSSNVVNDMEQRNLLRALSSSQTASKGVLKVQQEDPQMISKSATFETEINDDKRRREDNALQATWFVDPKYNLATFTNKEVAEEAEAARENSNIALNAAASATVMTSTDIRNAQNSKTMSSAVRSKAETKMHSENQLEESDAMSRNWAISRISATSNEVGDNDKNKLLKASSLSESHSTLAEGDRRVTGYTQNSQESMAAAKASSGSTVSRNDVRSRSKSAEKSTFFASPEEARRKQRWWKSDGAASEAALITTSNDVNNEHRDGALRGASSVVSYKEVQTDDELGDKKGARDLVKMAESAFVRDNKRKMNAQHVSLYDYRDGEHADSVINSRGDMRYSKWMDDINEMMSTGSVTSTVSGNADRNNLLKVISSDNLHAESLREDEDKSDIRSGADGAAAAAAVASTEITSYDDKQARGNILRKLIFLSNPGDEAQMMHGGNYEITKKLPTANGDKKLHGDNLRKMLLSDGLQVKNGNVESTADTSDNTKDAADLSTSTDTADVNFEGESQDDPNTISTANIQNENQMVSSTDTRARSEIDQKSSVSWENEIIDTETRDKYDMWRTKYQTTASSSSRAETRKDKFAGTLKTKASTESMSSHIDEISHKGGSTCVQSSSTWPGSRNYGDHQGADMADAAEARASAETSISNVPPIECQDDAQKEASAISQLKRHNLNARDEDKGIASDVPQSAEETEFNGVQNAQQRKLSGSVTSSGWRAEVQREEVGSKEGLEVTVSAATSAQTASSEAVESESREKLIGASSESDSYTKSRGASKHSFNAVSRHEQIIASAEASADSAASNSLGSVRRGDWLKKDSLAGRDRDTQRAKIEDENVLRGNLANIADFATSSVKETGYGSIEDERQSGVTTTASLSNSRAEAQQQQQQRDYNSSVRRESTETSSSDMQHRVLETESIVGSMEENLNAAANAATLAYAISSSGIQDSSKTLSSANSYANLYAESHMGNTQRRASNELRNVEIDKSLQTTWSSDGYANARATGENTDGIEEDPSAVANARTETTAFADIKDTDPPHGPFDLLNAAGNSQEAANAEVSAMSLVSAPVDARGKHTDNFMREESNVDSWIRGMTETGNDDSTLQIDQRNSGNAEASAQAASFSDVKDELQEGDEHRSRVLQERRFITADSSAASSVSETFDRADSIQGNNLEELTATSSSDGYESSNVESESRVNVLAKDRTVDVLDARTSTQTMASNEFRSARGDELLQTTPSSGACANSRATGEDTNGAGEDSSAVASARTETAISSDTKRMDSRSLFDLLTGAVTRTRAEGEAISRGGTIKEDLARTSSDVLAVARVDSGRAGILSGNCESSASVDAIAETGSGDRRDRQGDWRGTASWFGGTRDGQFGVTKSTSSANSHAAAQTTSEGSTVEEDPGVNTSMLAAGAHNRVRGGVDPSGWLVTTSDAGAVAEGRAQNKDELGVLREVGEVAVCATASTGAADAGGIGSERRDSRAEEAAECQDGATKIRHTTAARSGASAAAMTSMKMENESEGRSVCSNQMTASSSNEAIAQARARTEGKSDVSRNSKSSVNIERTRSSTAASAASTFDNLGMNHRARHRQSWNGMPASAPISKEEIRHSSGETTILYPPREISKCDENVETREFISEATSLYQTLDKQQGSEILLMKKNPRGPVQVASLKNSVPPFIGYRLIPREVYERIRAIIARKQSFCANCALSRALETRAIA